MVESTVYYGKNILKIFFLDMIESYDKKNPWMIPDKMHVFFSVVGN
jgi:hypothetical protein